MAFLYQFSRHRIDGPFAGFNVNSSLKGLTPTTVPIPAAVWLSGFGLVGLVRRRKA